MPWHKEPSNPKAPKPTGSAVCEFQVLQCQVLRCQELATRNFVIDDADWGLVEAVVCEAHAVALKRGERYIYDSVENVIYMGQDMTPESR